MINARLIPDPRGSIADAQTLRAAQHAYDAICALDAHLATLAPNGDAYARSATGTATLRAYFAVVDAIAHAGILMADD
jgi:hypothetical protein